MRDCDRLASEYFFCGFCPMPRNGPKTWALHPRKRCSTGADDAKRVKPKDRPTLQMHPGPEKERERKREFMREKAREGEGTPEETSIIGTRLSDGPGRSQKSTLKPTAMPLVGSERLGVLGPSIAIAMTGPEARRAAIGTASACRLLSLCAQHAHDVVEGLLDIDAVLGGGLDEVAAELLGQRLAFLR